MPNHEIYGLVGRALGHSWSASYFADFFARTGRDAEYRNFEIADLASEFPVLIDSTPQLRGLNVTIPYKQQIIPLLDALSPEAQAVGAVNVITIEPRAGRRPLLTGHNTDIIGFRETIRELISGGNHRSALVLGNGGASRAVCHGLRQLGVSPVVVSRTPEAGQLGYADLTPDVMHSHTVIVNTTPLGMWPNTDAMPSVPLDLVDSRHVCYDLVYNPDPTLWLRECSRRGAAVCSGLAMLHRQADAAWKIWQGVR